MSVGQTDGTAEIGRFSVGKLFLTCRKSSWRVRMRVMRSRTAVSTVAREISPCLNTHHLVPPSTVRGGNLSWNCPCCDGE